MTELSDIAAKVQARAAELLSDANQLPAIDPAFIKQCLDNNERGDGILYATLHRGRYLYNTTPKDGEWYAWGGQVWERDDYSRSLDAVEEVALVYQKQLDQLKAEISEQHIDKNHEESYKLALRDKYKSRCDRLRSATGAAKVLHWARITDISMACSEPDFDNKPWLLPVANGVIDMQVGALTTGIPSHLLTRRLDVAYDPHADYTPWQEFINAVSGSPEIAAFIKRSLGMAATGHSYEQYIWVFVGPGRNGKGVLFEMIADILGPYYHEISRGMIIEQRTEPSPAATSEHKYSLLRKRVIVAAETNKGQKIDAGAVKELTGQNPVKCRPLFRSEVRFLPTHNLFLQTNNLPVGLTRDFALVQRLFKIEFPFMYVDDPEAEAKKYPAMADRFRKKDPILKDKLHACRQGILRWLVEGCLEWQQIGLAPPQCILDGVTELQTQEDYIGQFIDDCLEPFPDDDDIRIRTTDMHDAFKWWWSQNRDDRERVAPNMQNVNAALRDRGHHIEKRGGKFWLYRFEIKVEIREDVAEFLNRKGAKS